MPRVLIRKGEKTQGKEGHVKTGEAGAVQRQERQGLTGSARSEESALGDPASGPPRGPGLPAAASQAAGPHVAGHAFLFPSAIRFAVICYDGPRKLIQ